MANIHAQGVVLCRFELVNVGEDVGSLVSNRVDYAVASPCQLPHIGPLSHAEGLEPKAYAQNGQHVFISQRPQLAYESNVFWLRRVARAGSHNNSIILFNDASEIPVHLLVIDVHQCHVRIEGLLEQADNIIGEGVEGVNEEDTLAACPVGFE